MTAPARYDLARVGWYAPLCFRHWFENIFKAFFMPVPKISIIIQTYNRLWCLPRAVHSCRQSAISSEIIVVDDGSADETWDWLQAQPDVTAIKQTNWGKDHAVNRGFDMARGEFVRFLDSDDLVVPGADAAL